MVDPGLNKEKLWIEPGIGNFGGKNKNTTNIQSSHICLLDRYFGTEEDEY